MEIKYCPKMLNPPPTVYEPSEDTFLLIECIEEKDIQNKRVLEIGTGSGIIAYTVSHYTSYVYANDVCKNAIKFSYETSKIPKYFLGKDIESIKLNNIDVIIFNPPYLPRSHPTEVEHHYSEKRCNHTVIKILHAIKNKNIIFYFILSSLCNPQRVFNIMKRNHMDYTIIKSKRFFFEEIYVVKCKSNR